MFYVEEITLINIYKGFDGFENRLQLIKTLENLEFTEEEKDMADLTKTVVRKLSAISDIEFQNLDFDLGVESMYPALINISSTIKSNTENVYLKSEILDFIQNNDFNSDYFVVFDKILRDGHDITGFALVEVPHPNIYNFYNYEKDEAFHILIDYFDNSTEKASVGYTQWTSSGLDLFEAESIAEAIEKYDDTVPK